MSTPPTEEAPAVQGRLWGDRTDDWVTRSREGTLRRPHRQILDAPASRPVPACSTSAAAPAWPFAWLPTVAPTSRHSTPAGGILAHARRRVPGAPIVQGELEQLPFAGETFDVVTGFNSFQYAAPPAAALAEAVPRPPSRWPLIPLLTWGPPEPVRQPPIWPRSAASATAAPRRAGTLRALGAGDVDRTVSSRSGPQDVTVDRRRPTACGATPTSRPRSRDSRIRPGVRRSRALRENKTVRAAAIEVLAPFRDRRRRLPAPNVFRYAVGTRWGRDGV